MIGKTTCPTAGASRRRCGDLASLPEGPPLVRSCHLGPALKCAPGSHLPAMLEYSVAIGASRNCVSRLGYILKRAGMITDGRDWRENSQIMRVTEKARWLWPNGTGHCRGKFSHNHMALRSKRLQVGRSPPAWANPRRSQRSGPRLQRGETHYATHPRCPADSRRVRREMRP